MSSPDGGGSPPTGWDTVKVSDIIEQSVSVLAAGLIGFINYIGLKDEELRNVLRNEPIAPSVVAVIAAAAFVIAVYGATAPARTQIELTAPTGQAATVPDEGRISRKVVRRTGSAIAVIFALLTFLTYVPVSAYRPTGWQFWVFLLTVAGLAIWAIAWWVRASSIQGLSRFRRRPFAIALALTLTALSGYGALRMEERSQVRASYPVLGASTTYSMPQGTVTLTATATRMATGSSLELVAYGVPHSWGNFRDRCKDKPTLQYTPPCIEAPCQYQLNPLKESECAPLGYQMAQPDANGSASASVVATFRLTDFEQVEVVGRVCRPVQSDEATDDNAPNGTTCEADDRDPTDPPKLAFESIVLLDP